MIATIKSTARKLKGVARRAFQVEAACDYCQGSARLAERKFGWSRNAVQKGLEELASGVISPDAPKTGCHGFFERLLKLQSDNVKMYGMPCRLGRVHTIALKFP